VNLVLLPSPWREQKVFAAEETDIMCGGEGTSGEPIPPPVCVHVLLSLSNVVIGVRLTLRLHQPNGGIAALALVLALTPPCDRDRRRTPTTANGEWRGGGSHLDL
jgi:hypothetical protein